MIKIKIKNINISFLNFFNKQVLKKNVILKSNKTKSFLIKTNHKKRTTKLVTLRAPKHFKVGRHHYSIITNFMRYQFNISTKIYYLKNEHLHKYLTIIKNLITKKKIPAAFNNLNSIKICFKIKKKFIVY